MPRKKGMTIDHEQLDESNVINNAGQKNLRVVVW
jgi:hypothetical protein